MHDLEAYLTEDGQCPFAAWLWRLADARVQARILARLDRLRLGDLGDWKPLLGSHGLADLRDAPGPGYRIPNYHIYFSIIDRRTVLLLAGSTRREQRRTIERAGLYLVDYLKRT